MVDLNFESRSHYMRFEGTFAGVALFVSFICFSVVMVCLSCSRRRRNNRLFVAGTHLIRAGEAFADASEVLLRELQTESNSSANIPSAQSPTVQSIPVNKDLETKCEIISKSLSRLGAILETAGCVLVHEVHLEKDDQIQIDFRPLVKEDMSILSRYQEVIKLLAVARDSLMSAKIELEAASEGSATIVTNNEADDERGSEPSEPTLVEKLVSTTENFGKIVPMYRYNSKINEFEAVTKLQTILELFEGIDLTEAGDKSSCCANCCTDCCTKRMSPLCKFFEAVPFRLFSFYRIVFRHSVEEVTLPGPGTSTRREFLLGGYGVPKRPFMVHAYFLTMVLLVANWFLVMFFDTAFYRKTTTCNDLNTRRDAYLCFDVSKSILAGPTNCTDPVIKDDLDIYVLCYLQYFNFPVALSLAFSFAQVIILLIHISFTLTLWCVKNVTPYAALVIHLIMLVSYIIFWVVYLPILYTNVNNLEYKGNLFYGHRILRFFMAFLGLLTLLFLTIFSPYKWLIDKNNREHRPTYGYHHGKKNGNLNSHA